MAETTSLPLTSIVSASPQQVSCELHGEAAILNLKNGKYYTLNAVGARIWELVQSPVEVVSIYDTISREYSVDRGHIEIDIERLIHDLAKNELLVINPASQ